MSNIKIPLQKRQIPRDIYNAHEFSHKEWEEENLAMIDCVELGETNKNRNDWCI